MLLPAAPPSTSSQSDITTFDQFASAPSTTLKNIFGGPASSHPPRSSPPTASMGQVVSRPQVTTTFPPSSAPSSLGGAALNTGSRFKRAFVGRRKKSDVATSSTASSPKISQGKEPQSDDSTYGSTSSTPRHIGAKQLTLQLAQHVFNKKHGGSAPASPAMSGLSLPPPPLPPKHTPQLSLPSSCLTPLNTNVDKRVSVMTTSSPIGPALDYMRRSDEHAEHITLKENERKDPERLEAKEIRRKSDSTLSHHTIRPGLGGRTPRPVSLAESLQSTHTIVPVNKRLSALLTDAEYITPEEEVEEGQPLARSASPGRLASPVPSLRVRDRRSQSLSLGPPLSLMVSAPANASLSLDAISPLPRSVSEERQRERLVTRETAAATFSSLPLNATRPAGVLLPVNFVHSVNLRSNSPLSRVDRTLPDLPQPPRRVPLAPQPNPTPPSFRQTAISMTSGFAPAAGLARRAVEKMGRVWGSRSASPSPLASPVGMPPSTFSTGRVGPPSRAGSSHSESTHHEHGKKSRHNPQSPSVSSTGSSLSDYEGPQLGKRLRGPVRISPNGVGIAGGLVFGRDLRSCVRDTAIDSVRTLIPTRSLGRGGDSEESRSSEHLQRSEPSPPLDSRYVPAVVVRCAQHILAWGVQEQGLFRVSGRSSHVAKLRIEFDTGADFDIVQSNPGDLDPHAVASIFKAYLRELPEPILTNHLMPYFDAAMASERLTNNAQDPPPPNPKNILPGLRKPPSLSTLSMPNFGGAHPPSDSLRKALSSLIARLPQENRDLLLTVTEVINHTAKRSSETRMPLSNLLLVLCPSLSMNPSLLQALCESEDIWKGVQPSREAQTLTAITEDAHQSPVERLEAQSDNELPAGADKSTSCPKLLNESKRLVRPLPNVPVEDPVQSPEVVVVSGPVNIPDIPAPPVSVSVPSRPRLSQDTIPRVPIDSYETSSSFSTTDDSSSVSHLSQGGRPVTPTSVNFRLTNPYSLSCSTDSLSVVSSGSPIHLVKPLPLVDDCGEPQSSNSPHSPVIAEPIALPIPILRPRRSALQAQFQFPGTGDNVTRSPLTHRKSTPSISVSSSISAEASSASSASRAKRLKKPSLHLLFAKRSASPMTSPSTQSQAVGASPLSTRQEGPSRWSSASESSPDSMVTAPQSSRFSYPPVLNTAIDESSISLALGIEDVEEVLATSGGDIVTRNSQVSMRPNTPVLHDQTSPPLETSKEDSFRHLDISLLEDDELGEDDWTQSVLLAAGESSW
ncbi:hypothetical protein PAXINDRAFT_166808 [Paxillus involutus ATCC 200175]|nr:hypothetical protein PAXINDRAFT_166808 [Paxillus involutus ATCC 200175]